MLAVIRAEAILVCLPIRAKPWRTNTNCSQLEQIEELGIHERARTQLNGGVEFCPRGKDA